MRKIADSHVHIRFTRDEDIARMLDDIASVGVTAVNILSLSYRGVAEDLAALWQKMTRKDLDIRAFGESSPSGMKRLSAGAYIILKPSQPRSDSFST